MSDFERQLGEAGRHVGTQWSATDQAEVRGRIARALIQRRRRRRAAGMVAGLLAVSSLTWWGISRGRVFVTQGSGRVASGAAVPGATAQEIALRGATLDGAGESRLPDGTRLVAAAGARWKLTSASAGEVTVQLISGRIDLDVPHVESRRFRIDVGAVRVTDLGTRFSVERSRGQVDVAVRSGRVHVEDGDGITRELSAGESFSVEEGLGGDGASTKPGASGSPGGPAVSTPKPGNRGRANGVHPFSSGAASSGAAYSIPASSGAASPGAASPGSGAGYLGMRASARGGVDASEPEPGSWRALARAGQYDRAFELLGPGASREVGEDAGSLLLAADVARLSGHPDEAVPYLEGFLRRHEKDRRASLAAFTLGRVLLNDLSKPRDAALAFRRARELDPAGPLLEDALARETESWSRAGENVEARESAEAFLRRFPHSRRVGEIRRFAGMR